MDPQLAKLMARRRRKADGDQGSSSAAGERGAKRSTTPPPPPPPPPASKSTKPKSTPSRPRSKDRKPTSPVPPSAPLALVHADGTTTTTPIPTKKASVADSSKDALYSPSVFEEDPDNHIVITSPSSSSARKRSSRTAKSRLSEEELSELDAVVAAVDASFEMDEPVANTVDSNRNKESDDARKEVLGAPTTMPMTQALDPPPATTDSSPPPRTRLSRQRSTDSGMSGDSDDRIGSKVLRKHSRRRSEEGGATSEHQDGDNERRRSLIKEIEGRKSTTRERRGSTTRPRRSPTHKLPDTLEEELLAVTGNRNSPSKSSRRRSSSGTRPQRLSGGSRSHRHTLSVTSSYSNDSEDNGGDHKRNDDGRGSVSPGHHRRNDDGRGSVSPSHHRRNDDGRGSVSPGHHKRTYRKPSTTTGRASSRSPGRNEKRKSFTIPSLDRDGFGTDGNERSMTDLFDSINFGGSKDGNGYDNNKSLRASAVMEVDFGSFPAAFGSLSDSKPSKRKNDTAASDPFGLPTAVSKDSTAEYEPPPSFDLELHSGWGEPPPKTYDTSPIDKPPVNHVESESNKIKWISPRPNMIVSSSLEYPNPAPVTNPLTGNLIICRPSSRQTHQLLEWDTQKKTQVVATTILTMALKRQIVEQYRVTPASVDRVWNVCAGVHRISRKGTSGEAEGIRVAALIDLTILGDSKNEVLRVIAVWNWGFGRNSEQSSIQLQSVLSPPSGQDFSYDTDSMLVADGCVFVGGGSSRGPCIFLNKPTIRETWSANFISKNNIELKITHMAVTNCPKSPPDPDSGEEDTIKSERLPYLAIALDDGSLSVWTYDAAVKLSGKTKEAVRKLLFPLCRLHATKVLQTCPVTAWSNKEQMVIDGSTSDTNRVGYCTHLEWIPYRASAHKQLLLLAASFQGALCLYHVALPKIPDRNQKGAYIDIKAPNEKTILAQTIAVKPFCYSKWIKPHKKASCSFVDMGPHVPPSLAVLLSGLDSNEDYARMALVTCPLPSYIAGKNKSRSSGVDHLPFHVWDTHDWTKRGSNFPSGLVTSSLAKIRGIMYYTDTAIQEIEYRTNTRFPVDTSGVGSIPCGLTTSGTNYWADSITPLGVGVLSVYTTFHCDRFKSTLSPDPSSPTLLEWTAPSRRHWLVQTFMGDSKESKCSGSMKIRREEKEADDVVLGGAQPTVMCELVTRTKVQNLYPYRVARNPYTGGDSSKGETSTQCVAIWFRPLFGHCEPRSIGLVEKDRDGQYGIVQLVEGRDVVFLPNTSTSESDASSKIPQALVVSRNGGSVTLWQRKEATDTLKNPWQKMSGSSCRPILGNSPVEEGFVELRQFVATRFQDQLSLVAVASGSSGRHCLLAGKLVPENRLEWTSLLPNMKEDSVLYLDEREQVSIVIPLPGEGSLRGGLGVATTQRILILSSDLKIMAEILSDTPPGSLVPMGSYTVAYCSDTDHKLRYLSGLPEAFGRSGVIASFPTSVPSHYSNWLAGIRPDRVLYSSHQSGTRLVERGQSTNSFLLPLTTTRPVLLLEPMIANAIATGGKEASVQPFLRTVLEKFGRKVATMSHGEDEGIGNFGTGMSSKVFELLEYYKLKPAASWLLTGTVNFERSANSRILPSYLPVTVKTKAAFDTDTHLHLIANGDQYFMEYVKSPDNNMSSTLPLPSDPAAILCKQFGMDAIKDGNFSDAVKMLDMAGTQVTDAMILQLSMALQLDSTKGSGCIIECLYQQGTEKTPSAVTSLAALATELRKGKMLSPEFNKQWMQSLAPSVQQSRKYGRHRTRIIGEASLSKVTSKIPTRDELFSQEIPESKLVWNEGPNREKENLLILDDIKEWFGRSRPVVLGKEGAKSAQERGASTLAGILSNDDEDSFGGENDDDFKDGWVDGVGEGLKDEDKLSAYFRFSEGDDDDSGWREEGIADITKFENTAFVVGNLDDFDFQESTSSVDEGESGKVKALYDLVFGQSGIGQSSALTISASRGGSLDLGVMHGPDHISRQKCTIEFWIWVPESINKEIILVRRTFGSSAGDFDVVCKASDKSNLLWELGLHKDGELEFRTIAGKSVKTQPEPRKDEDDCETPTTTVHFSRWNHICVIMKQESMTSSTVSLFVRGTKKIEPKSLSFAPPGFEVDDFSGASALDPMLETSHLVFGLDHAKDYRITELRIWALDRKDDDVKTLMREYLECAEIKKKKFNIKIKKKLEGRKAVGLTPPKQGLLSPPGGLKPPTETQKTGLLSPPVGLKPPNDSKPKRGVILAPPKQSTEESLPEAEKAVKTDTNFGTGDFASHSFGGFGEPAPDGEDLSSPVLIGSGFFGGRTSIGSDLKEENLLASAAHGNAENTSFATEGDEVFKDYRHDEEELEISPLWESAIPLSEQVRTSAASAIIRGPPATRHFGGNRGGLPDYRELERLGVGAISICGSEKTIVWRDDQVPPGLTYPIGASGAIVSDQMDGDGSEFLCCFMAKDKRMVVFELSTRTIVVELQMTTKLNYWRFLPPEAGEDTLCFMLITPVGGFHWMPLDESPRPRQVWKRGPDLQGKKIVCYEEGGANGYEGPDMLSKVGLLLVTDSTGAVDGVLEAWLVPICGDSQVICASYQILGACLCQPPGMEFEPFMPLLLFVVEENNELIVCVSAVTQEGEKSIGLTEVMTDALIEQGPYRSFDFEPPALAMGTYPEVLCCSLGTTVVVIVRRKGLVVAYELAESGLELIAQENVGHYVVDAVMRYNAAEGGAEIVLLMSDAENRRDGRVGTFCFRAAC